MSDWIKIEDQLPEYGDPVIIVIKGTVQNVIYTRDGDDDTDDWFEPYHYDDKESAAWRREVSHWQPLPEPPK